jgi:hypothetical protein
MFFDRDPFGQPTVPSGVGVGVSVSGMFGGGPHAIAAFENADATVIVTVSSTISAGVNSRASAVRRSSVMPFGYVINTSA